MVETELQPPGAGLPPFEGFVSRYILMPLAQSVLTWNLADRLFRYETRKIVALYKSLPASETSTRVLIPKVWGIEDSSRHWSADMVLEHLIIVAKGLQKSMIVLEQEQNPNTQIDVARVKPKGLIEGSVLEHFETAMQQASYHTMQITNRNSDATLYHPWFGPLNTQGLHTLLAMHQNTHRRQLQKIIKILGK